MRQPIRTILFILLLLVLPALVHAQNPCTAPAPAGVTFNPTLIYAVLPE